MIGRDAAIGRTLPLDRVGARGRREEAAARPAAPAAIPRRRPGVAGWLLALPLTLLLAAPLAALVWRGLSHPDGFSPEALATLRQALTLSLTTSALSVGVIALGGLPLAYAIARRGGPLARALDVLVDLPIVLPPSVAGIALLLAFGRNGVVGRWLAEMGITLGFTTAAVVLAQIFVAAPFFVRAAAAAFRRIDRSVEESASDLGASPRAVFRTVTLPMAAPGLAAGLVLAWARALGEFGATIMFAGNFPGVTQTMPLAIYGEYGAGDLDTAILLSFALLVASALMLAGVRALTGQAAGIGRDA